VRIRKRGKIKDEPGTYEIDQHRPHQSHHKIAFFFSGEERIIDPHLPEEAN
jgi:hypothetical protein